MLLVLLAAAALASRETLSVGNDEIRDGVSGISVLVDIDEAGLTARHDVKLDPAAHRIYLLIRDATGRVIYDGIRARAPGRNQATTTPPLPADDGKHAFFIPYHRLDLPQGTHEVQVQVHLTGRFPASPLQSPATFPARVQQPAMVWEFVWLDRPPAPDNAPWRIRVGKDVLAEPIDTPALVVLSAADELDVDVRVQDRWRAAEPQALALVAPAAPPGRVRLTRSRRPLPRLAEGAISAGVEVRNGQAGVAIELRWTLEGMATESMIELEPRVWSADSQGVRRVLLGQVEQNLGDRARLWVPTWGLPHSVESGRPIRLGWDLVAKGGGLTRDVALPGREQEVRIDQPLRASPVVAAAEKVRLTETGRGLFVEGDVRWALPDGLAGQDGAELRFSWSNATGGAPTPFPWTPCAPLGDPAGCPEAWGLGPVRSPHGASRISLPLGWLDPRGADGATLTVEAGRTDYRGARGQVRLALALPPVRDVTIRPGKIKVDCPSASSYSLRVVPGAGGVERGSTRPRPCGDARFTSADEFTFSAFDGDIVRFEILVDDRPARALPLAMRPGATLSGLVDPTAGVHKARIRIQVR